MDLNLVVLAGRLAAPPELRAFESGATLIRYLVTVRSGEPRRRVDVVPVTLWNPPDRAIGAEAYPGVRVWIAGAVERRFWDASSGRRSRLEVIAHQVDVRDTEEESLRGTESAP